MDHFYAYQSAQYTVYNIFIFQITLNFNVISDLPTKLRNQQNVVKNVTTMSHNNIPNQPINLINLFLLMNMKL